MNVEPLRFLNINTHVGQSLRQGGTRRAKKKYRPHVVTLQEVQHVPSRLLIRVIFNPLQWSCVGHKPKSWGRGAAGSMVLVRRSRMKKIESNNTLVSHYRGKWHPERRTTFGVYVDKKTQKKWFISSVHTWTMAGGTAAWIREGHETQARAYFNMLTRARKEGGRGVAVGDWNERIGNGTLLAERLAEQHEVVPARLPNVTGVSLDEAFVTKNVKVLKYNRIPRAELTTDHEGLYFECL